MRENRPSFPFYPKDWIASTRGLSAAARGFHIDMLALAWLNGGCDADQEALRRSVGAERAEWRRVWPELATRWSEVDGRLVNRRLEGVREEQTAYTEAKRIAGKQGGRASVLRRTEVFGSPNPRSNREAEREATCEAGGEAVVNPASASTTTKKRTPLPPIGGESDPLFARFYDAFPKKVAPDAAYSEWRKRKPDEALLRQMLEALEWQIEANDWGPRNPYTPRASKWLREGQWKNEKPLISAEDEEPEGTPLPAYRPPQRVEHTETAQGATNGTAPRPDSRPRLALPLRAPSAAEVVR